MPQADLFDEYDRSRDEASGVLDGLLARTNQYRSSRAFAELLQFVGRLPTFAPFNAALLHAQNPDIEHVASAARWSADFGRQVKPDARAYVVLIPFGPVQFVYDVADTYAEDPTRDRVPADLRDPFATHGELDPQVWYRTSRRCEREAIALVEDSTLDGRLAGDVRALGSPTSGGAMRYLVRLNGRHEVGTRYATLAHELAHLFCGHIGADEGAWWEPRPPLSTRHAELEAEAVAYLVCRRAGLTTMSEHYLSGYVDGDDFELPELSLDAVIIATGYIESMGRPSFRSKRKPAKT